MILKNFVDSKYAIEITKLITNHEAKEFHSLDYDCIYGTICDMLSEYSEKLCNVWNDKMYDWDEYYDDFSMSNIKGIFDMGRLNNILCEFKIDVSEEFIKKLLVLLNRWLQETFNDWEEIQDSKYVVEKWQSFCGCKFKLKQ